MELKAQQTELQSTLGSLLEQIRVLNRQPEKIPNHSLRNEMDALVENLRNAADRVAKHRFGSVEFIVQDARVEHITVGSKATQMIIGDGAYIGKVELFEPWQVDLERSRVRMIKLKSSLPENAALLPGSTAVYTATLNVKRSITFAPATYRLQFFVNYSFESTGTVSTDEKTPTQNLLTNRIAHDLAIRPPIYAVVLGSVSGGVIGSVARLLQLSSSMRPLDVVVAVFVAMILSGMAVVFLARKSDAQSFVSVEDFWGGMLMGFLVGYTGTSFFGTLTGVHL